MDRTADDEASSAVPSGREVLRGLLARLAADHGHKVAAFRDDATPITFAALEARTQELADRLPDGVRRVALRMPNAVDSVAAVHAAWRRGASAVLIPAMVPEAEVQRRLALTQAQALLRLDLGEPSVEPLAGSPELVDDEAVVVFTSGTTGRPKGAVLGFESLAGSIRSIATGIGRSAGRPPLDPPRRPNPIFMSLGHVGGFLATLNGMYQGKPVVIFDKFRAEEVFDLVERFDLTMLRLSPTMVFDLAAWPEDRSLGRVRTVSVGSAPLSEELRSRFEERYGAIVLQSYGLTELAGAIAFDRYEDGRDGRRKPGTVGRLAPDVQVRIVDGQGRDVERGDVGEIQATGPSRFLAYLDDGATVPAPDGWVRTGDLGRLDDDGFLTVLGRHDDVILCGGFNVYPPVVEAALCDLPGVIDAMVVGLPDARLGEVPAAAIVTADGHPLDDDEVRARLRELLAPYEVPRRMTSLDRLPLTDGGKPDRATVAELIGGAH